MCKWQANTQQLTDFVARQLDVVKISLPLQEGEKALEHRLDATASLRQGNEQAVGFFTHQILKSIGPARQICFRVGSLSDLYRHTGTTRREH
jgi:hypothetical protein